MRPQGITKQRLVDLVTDTLRAQLLRVCGYETSVVEFVSTEHTPRNTLIRAVLRGGGGGEEEGAAAGVEQQAGERRQQLWREYVELKAFFGGVTPCLETLLADDLRRLGLDGDLQAQQ